MFAALALLWLAYLVPLYLHRDQMGLADDIEPEEPITASVTIVRRGVPLDVADDSVVVVSTPLHRRAALRELAMVDARAAFRRRIVLGVLLLAVAVVGVLVYFRELPWWIALIPVSLIGVFVGIARVTVVRMRRSLDARAALVRAVGHNEETVAISVLGELVVGDEASIDLTAPIEAVASLWDPVPITRPTYVSKPLAARTVRTIDLSSPVFQADGGLPVTADAPVLPGLEGDSPDAPRAVGE